MFNVIYRILAILCLMAFYGIYFGKMLLQRKQGIETDQIGKGGKRGRLLIIECLMKVFSFATPIAEGIAIIIGTSILGVMGKVIGVYFCIISVIVFGTAVYTMRDSWRAGIPSEDKTEFVSKGIYKYSRNPAFVGFDFMYIGICLMYCSIWLLLISIGAIVMFHLQILEEEKFLEDTFKDEYIEYRKNVRRYLGTKPVTIDTIIRDVYVVLFAWSILYTFTCIGYAGLPSFLWLWPLIALWCAVRIRMLCDRINGRRTTKKWLTWSYRLLVLVFLIFFAFVESKIISAMNEKETSNLDYIIVLGAGVDGTVPRRPLSLRISYAYEYLQDNPETMVVASGGQGIGEDISEAECIRRELVKRGIDNNRIILENQSTSTEENLRFSKQYVPQDSSVGILTNSFHLYRAKKIAWREGYSQVYGLAGTTLMPMGIHYVVREFFGVVRLLL